MRGRVVLVQAITLATVIAGIGLIVVRGLIGERINELSILFRWFYMQGAARLVAEHPIVGVGPAGFQDAFLATRPPLTVEEVTSPHSILLDYTSTLGVFGLAWATLLISLLWRIGCNLATVSRGRSEPLASDELAPPSRRQIRTLALVGATGVLIASRFEITDMTISRASVWLAALAVYWGVGVILLRTLRPPSTALLAASGMALVLAAHAQIEVTPVQPGSAALFFTVFGMAAAATQRSGSDGSAPPKHELPLLARGLVPVFLFGAAALLVLRGALPALVWQSDLRRSAETLRPFTEVQATLMSPSIGSESSLEHNRALHRLGSLLGRPVRPDADAVSEAMTQLELKLLPPARQALESAGRAYPDQWKVRRAAAMLALEHSRLLLDRGETPEAEGVAGEAISVMGRCWQDDRPTPNATAAELRALALVFESRHRLLGDGHDLSEAATILESVMAKDPLNLRVALRLFEISMELGHEGAAAKWGREALRLDDLQRLDYEVRGLGERARARIEGAIGNP